MPGKKSKIVATRHVCLAQNYQSCGRGSAPDPTGGAYITLPDPLADFQGKGRGKGGGEGTSKTKTKGSAAKKRGCPLPPPKKCGRSASA